MDCQQMGLGFSLVVAFQKTSFVKGVTQLVGVNKNPTSLLRKWGFDIQAIAPSVRVNIFWFN